MKKGGGQQAVAATREVASQGRSGRSGTQERSGALERPEGLERSGIGTKGRPQGRSGWARRMVVKAQEEEPQTSRTGSHSPPSVDERATLPSPRSSTPGEVTANTRLALERQPTMKSLPATRWNAHATPASAQDEEQDPSGERRTLVKMQRSRWLDTPLTAEPAFEMPTPQKRSPALSEEHLLQLLWLDPDCLPRLQGTPRWRRLLNETAERSGSDVMSAGEETSADSRARVHRLLTYADSADGQQLREAVNNAVSDTRRYQPPLMLVDATVGVTFACTEELSTYLSLVQGMTPEPDAKLAGAIKRGQALVGARSNHSAITAEVLSDLRRAFTQTHRHLPQGYLAREAEHQLLVERAYAYRQVMGGRFLRADVVLRSGSQTMVGYLPEALATVLPMEAQLRARMLVEVHPRQDSYEPSSVALKALAVGWVCLRPQL